MLPMQFVRLRGLTLFSPWTDPILPISKGKGSVILGKKKNPESGYVYQTFASSPVPFSPSMALSKEIDRVIKRIGGTNSDILEGVIPPKKRKIVRALYGLHMVCMLGGASLGAISYFKYGEADFVFKSQPYGLAIGLVLGLGALIGIFGAQGIVITHKNPKSEPDASGQCR
jgi:hypothetical protein